MKKILLSALGLLKRIKRGEQVPRSQLLLASIAAGGLIILVALFVRGVPRISDSFCSRPGTTKPSNIPNAAWVLDPDYIPVTKFDEITLSATRIAFGLRLHYTMTIRGNGYVDYHQDEGTYDATPIPRLTTRIRLCKEGIEALVAVINDTQYPYISTHYDYSHARTSTPGGSRSSVKIGDKTFSVKYAYGSGSQGASQLRKFENDINAIIKSSQWNRISG